MRSKIINNLKQRINNEIAPQSPLKYLLKINVEEYVDSVISVVYLYTRPKRGLNKNVIYMVEIISAIGHSIRSKYKLPKDSAIAAKTGAFILYTFEYLEMLQTCLGQGTNGHNAYIVQILDDEAICKLWENLEPSQIEKLPSEVPYKPWRTAKHETGMILVKTQNEGVLKELREETHPIVFACINKAQEVGWNINKELYDITAWALRNKTDAFADIWEQQNPEAKATKTREATAIIGIAKRFIGKTFYHLYYYDFRGRKYPTTAYLHEQGTDLARGLLLRGDKKPIQEDGYFWLLVSIASNWAGSSCRTDGAKTDKIPLFERFEWCLDNEEILLSYAENPKVNQGWMKADKPWQFLAACIELRKLREYQFKVGDFNNLGYESHLECYIDGSNNGSQHLSALTRDEITAPHVNLIPLDLPGDLYKYVADHVWERIDAIVAKMSKEEVARCERYIDNLIEFKKQINAAEPKSDNRQILVQQIKNFKSLNEEIAMKAAAVFWARVKDNKERRKVVKRNVMTLPYGGTSYGLGEQQISDSKKHGIDLLYHMEHRWGSYMGREIYEDCRISLERPMRLLEVFELAGRRAEARGEFLKWHLPITGFPVVQHYVEGTTKKIWVQYGPPLGDRLSTGYYENTLQLAVCFVENPVPSRGKQAQGASPNAIHSLDAAHLMMTVAKADFPITTIHDSFGCLLADMPKLFKIVRETFVELYQADPLTSLMNDIGGDLSNIQLGTLDITLVKDSEYCFS